VIKVNPMKQPLGDVEWEVLDGLPDSERRLAA